MRCGASAQLIYGARPVISPADWLGAAQSLPIGGKATIQHNCGSGRKLIVEHKPSGYAAWCHRCGLPGWVPKTLSLDERIRAMRAVKAADTAATQTIRPPLPCVFSVNDWPEAAKVWLYRAGLSKDWIEHLGFYFHADTGRVVMPVMDGDSLCFWQARGFATDQAKYISPALGPAQSKPVFISDPYTGAEMDRLPDTLALTEDILSAVRVGQTCEAWSLLGTALTPEAIRLLATRKPSRVLVWLDPDDAGVSARRKIVPKLRAMGLDAKAVRAPRDPKNFTFAEIRSYIHGTSS
jgi:hypothetical protein